MIQPIDKPVETKVEARPKGFHAMTPSLTCANARREIEFLTQALGARELDRMEDPDTKKIVHADLSIGDSIFMLNDASSGMGCRSFKDLGGSPVNFYLYVPDVDAAFARATKAGAKVKDTVKDVFWGDRVGSIECPEGFLWSLATHRKDLTPEQIADGFKQFKKQVAGASQEKQAAAK
jgi:PhnB protein